MIVWLAGCAGQGVVAEEMERALGESNDALVAALLSAEVLSVPARPAATTPTLRHSSTEDCTCPCVTPDGAPPVVVYTLDYKAQASGCVPDSGLVPTAVIGHAYFDWDGVSRVGATSWDGFELSLAHAVTGAFGGEVTGGPGDLTLTPAGEISVDGVTLAFDLDVGLTDDAVHLDGSVALTGADDDPRELALDGVVLPLADIGPPCPRPTEGTATLTGAARDVVVDFAASSDGFVVVTRGGRESEPTDFCAYASDLW